MNRTTIGIFGILSIILLPAVAPAAADVWKNVDPGHRVGGRQASEGYLRGKVVLIDCRDFSAKDGDAYASRMDQLWSGFKSKPFVLLGSHRGDEASLAAASNAIRRTGVTYPVYWQAAASDETPFEGYPYIFVYDAAGRMVYRGRDERLATERVVTRIGEVENPTNLKGLTKLIDLELKYLPAQAAIHIRQMREKWPVEAHAYDDAYDALVERPEIVSLVKLVIQVKKAKGYTPKSAAQAKALSARIDALIERVSPLKEDKDPAVAQEAKNNIAELRWFQAGLR